MKKIYYIILLFAYFALSACSDSVVGEMYFPSLTNQLLSVSPKELTFSEFGESKTLSVSTLKTPWKFVDYPDWITITPNSGDASTTVTVTAAQNESADVTRTCVFYLQSTDPKWEYKAYVSATQKNADAFIIPSPSSLTFDAGASTKSVAVTSNVKWEVKCNETWVTITQTNDGFDVKVDENKTGSARNATIQIYGGSVLENLNVSQQANGVSCSVDNLEFYQKGGTQEFTINSQTSWSAITSNEWIKVSPTTGVSGQNNISVTVDENPASYERHGFVYIQVGNTTVAQISIVQKGIYLTTEPTSLTFNPQSESKSVSISSNVEWIVSASDSWIKLSDKNGTGDGVITVSVDDNSSDIQRTGILNINSIDGTINKNINVIQSGISISIDVTQMHFSYKAEAQNLNLEVNTVWIISYYDTWLSFSPITGGILDKNLTVNVSENTEEDERTASFLINAGGFNHEVKVTQDGKYFNIDNEALTVRATANTISLDVKTSEEWTAEKNVSWLTVSPTSGTGDAKVTISVAENNSADSRQGKVMFKPADGRQIVINVTQNGKSITTTPSSVQLDYKGTAQKILVDADGKFSVSTTTSWIKISNITSSSFEISATEVNESSSSKSGTVTISLDGTSIKKTIDVTQSAMPEEKTCVDLGLPSGTLWARANLGAKTHRENGTYFQWGGISGGDEGNPCRDYKENIQGTNRDAATVLWGSEWVTPTRKQASELCTYCTCELITENGIELYKLTSRKNGNVLYFPKAGFYFGTETSKRSADYYWTSEPNLYFYDSYTEAIYFNPRTGTPSGSDGILKSSRLPIRPVKK